MKDRRDNGEIIVPAHQTRILQDAVDELGCDTMAVVVFSWAHTSVEAKAFIPTKTQHLKGWKIGQTRVFPTCSRLPSGADSIDTWIATKRQGLPHALECCHQ
eukprot:5450399-Amphidinium_carterae.1